jgi:hypothetical protein
MAKTITHGYTRRVKDSHRLSAQLESLAAKLYDLNLPQQADGIRRQAGRLRKQPSV